MKERVIEAFIDTIVRYFQTHKDAQTFEIGKGALAFKCGIGLTTVEALVQGISLETVSIKDMRGKIEVDRAGFKEWFNLRYQAIEEKKRADNKMFYLNQEAYGPAKEIAKQKERIEQAKSKIEELKKTAPVMKTEADRMEEEARKEEENHKTDEQIAHEKADAYRREHHLPPYNDDDEEYYEEEN